MGTDNTDTSVRTMNIVTLKELKTVTNAFDGFVTVKESKIPEYYKTVFPHKCLCGAEMIIDSTNNTRLQCCNPVCWVKWSYKLASFLSYHGFKGIGEETCKNLIKSTKNLFKYESYLSVFLLPDNVLLSVLGDSQFTNFCHIREVLKSSVFWLRDAIASLSVTEIGKASKLFTYVENPDILLSALLHNTTDNLCQLCGINDQMARFGLRASKMDIFVLVTRIIKGIRPVPKGTIHVAITGSVNVKGKPLTRKEFIDYCESITDSHGNPMFTLVETKSEKLLEYVISDGPSSSSKYTLGKKLGIIITADAFVDKLLERTESENKKIKDAEKATKSSPKH